jgi:hypothetical protein
LILAVGSGTIAEVSTALRELLIRHVNAGTIPGGVALLGAGNVEVAAMTLSQDSQHLTFTVADDGTGFDPAATPIGTGLQGITDRLAAIGGSIGIASGPGRGTRITGQIPATSSVARHRGDQPSQLAPAFPGSLSGGRLSADRPESLLALRAAGRSGAVRPDHPLVDDGLGVPA